MIRAIVAPLVGGVLAWQNIGVPKLFGKEIEAQE